MGVPYYGVLLSFLFCLLAYMNVSSGSAEVFTYFVNVVSLTGLIAWACILTFHIRFMKALKAQGLDRKKDLVYRSPLQPYGSYISLVICIVIFSSRISQYFWVIPLITKTLSLDTLFCQCF